MDWRERIAFAALSLLGGGFLVALPTLLSWWLVWASSQIEALISLAS